MSSSVKKSYLGDYVDFQNGYAFKSSEYTEQGHYLIRIKNVQQGYIEIGDKCFVKVPNEPRFEKFKLKSGDIVLSLTGNVGRIARIRDEHLPAVLNQRVARVAPKAEGILNTEYLYYLLRTPKFLEFAIGAGKGAAQQNISTLEMEKYEVDIPSLETQREIVKKLDSSLSEINLLERNLEISSEKFVDLKQSILNKVFSNSDVNEDSSIPLRSQGILVEKVRLSDICKFTRGLTYSKSDEVDFSNNIVLRANNIDLESNSLNLDDLRYIKETIQINKEKIVKRNSLIICTASGSKSHVGKVALIDNDYGYAFGGFMGLLTPRDICHPKFLFYVLISDSFKAFLSRLNDGTNINNLKFSDIQDYEVLLPTLEKQREIVEKLDRAFAEIERLKVGIRVEKECVSELRQSLLSRAFHHEEAVAQ